MENMATMTAGFPLGKSFVIFYSLLYSEQLNLKTAIEATDFEEDTGKLQFTSSVTVAALFDFL